MTGKYACKFPSEILKKAAKLKEELLKRLSEPVPYPSDSVKQQVSKRCQALAQFMENLLVGVKQQELKLDLPTECEPAASEHASMYELGEISPHHHSNHDDSKSSSETPPTYNQLNYFENLNRFFNSVQPKFVPNEFKSLPYRIDHVPTNEKDRMLSPIQQSGEESGGSFNSGSESLQFDSTDTSNTSNSENTNQLDPALTEALVSRHTDQMELQMVKNHKKYRHCVNDKKKAPNNGQRITTENQSIKRSWPNGLNNEMSKNSKPNNRNTDRYASNMNENAQNDELFARTKTDRTKNEIRPTITNAIGQSKMQSVPLWPPFPVNTTNIQNNIPINTRPTGNNQFLPTNQLSTPRCYLPSINPNGILKVDQVYYCF